MSLLERCPTGRILEPPTPRPRVATERPADGAEGYVPVLVLLPAAEAARRGQKAARNGETTRAVWQRQLQNQGGRDIQWLDCAEHWDQQTLLKMLMAAFCTQAACPQHQAEVLVRLGRPSRNLQRKLNRCSAEIADALADLVAEPWQ